MTEGGSLPAMKEGESLIRQQTIKPAFSNCQRVVYTLRKRYKDKDEDGEFMIYSGRELWVKSPSRRKKPVKCVEGRRIAPSYWIYCPASCMHANKTPFFSKAAVCLWVQLIIIKWDGINGGSRLIGWSSLWCSYHKCGYLHSNFCCHWHEIFPSSKSVQYLGYFSMLIYVMTLDVHLVHICICGVHTFTCMT